MAEWLYEEGIGENRAILIEGGEIVEAAIEIPQVLRLGSVHEGRLASISSGRRGIIATGSGNDALLEPLPARLTEGQALRIEIVREAIPELGRSKLARCRVSDLEPRDGPSLLERLSASPRPVTRQLPHAPDRFEESGWSELLEEAGTGEIAFRNGALRLSLTPAMTLLDVDGDLPPPELAAAGAAAAARTIRRLGITGSIGIDLPTMASRDDRHRAAAALDAVLPQPFERTAVNGFGFLQVVRRRERASIAELVRFDPVGAAARALLRKAERTTGSGDLIIRGSPQVIARIEAEPVWLELLARRAGAQPVLQGDPGLALGAGYAQRQSA